MLKYLKIRKKNMVRRKPGEKVTENSGLDSPLRLEIDYKTFLERRNIESRRSLNENPEVPEGLDEVESREFIASWHSSRINQIRGNRTTDNKLFEKAHIEGYLNGSYGEANRWLRRTYDLLESDANEKRDDALEYLAKN